MSDSTPAIQTDAAPPTPRARVEIGAHVPIYEQVNGAWAALMEANDADHPRVLVRGNALVRMTERGELEEFGPEALLDELSRVADFGTETETGWSPKEPTLKLATTLLARDSAEYDGAPVVDRVVDVPVLAPDLSMVTTSGYHASRIYYRPAPDLDGAAFAAGPPDTVDEVVEARDWLLTELLGDFEFADDASRAHALGLLILPFVRDYIDGPTPMHVILGPEPGTGKTYLAQAALYPGCGMVGTTTANGSQGEEWRKNLTSSLLAGERALLFDNLTGQLDSPTLAAAVTGGVWTDRILGGNKRVSIPIRNVWVATGNNLDLSDEQARRAVPIFLDPGETRPADRPDSAYRHPDLLGWIDRHRADAVNAALVLVRHWAAGRHQVVEGGHGFYREAESGPVLGDVTLGSFGGWARTIGGILNSADVDGFLSNRERLFAEANEETREAANFLRTWDGLGLAPMRINELVAKCGIGGELRSALPTDLAGKREDNLHKALVYWLREAKDRRILGFQLVYDTDARLWSVRCV
jgi:putative DNA primase/helicase